MEPSDAPLVFIWENNTENWLVSQTLVPFSMESIHRFVHASQEDVFSTGQIRLIIEAELSAVGCIDLFDFNPLNKRAAVGILIDSKFRRNHYALDALNQFETLLVSKLSLHQLYAHVLEHNQASIRLFEKAGYLQTSVLKDWIYHQKSWQNLLVFQKFFT